jgi:hypothetical protein
MSAAALASPWCKAEYQRALRRKIPLYIAVIEPDIPLESIHIILDTYQQVNCTPPQRQAGIGALVKAISQGEAVPKDEALLMRVRQRLSGTSFPRFQLDIPLCGREAEMAKIMEMLHPSPNAGPSKGERPRLLVLVAGGGAGKTRLAAEIAIGAQAFADGVLWVKLEPGFSELDLTYRLRDHLGLPPATDPSEVWAHLSQREALIILDNAETCSDKAAIAKRLQDYPMEGGSRVLMTSREQWKESKAFNRRHDLNRLELGPAAQIVREMAAAKGPKVAGMVAGQEVALAEAARRYPRLIRFAVDWLEEHPLVRVLKMLVDLKGGGEDLGEALKDMLGQTLEAIKSKPGGNRAVADLAKLLVTRGGFSDPAAEALLGDTDSLGILVRWSLLSFDGQRYTPDPLAADALESDESARPAHADYYLGLLKSLGEKQDYLGLAPEAENLTEVFEFLLAAGDLARAYEFLDAYSRFARNRGWFSQELSWGQRLQQNLENQKGSQLWIQAQTLLSWLYRVQPIGHRQKNLAQAIAYAQAALDYQDPEQTPLAYAANQQHLGTCYRNLADLADAPSNLAQAVSCYEAALRYRRPEISPLDYADTQNSLGNAYREWAKLEDTQAYLDKAIACYQAALRYRKPDKKPLDYAASQSNLGLAYTDMAVSEEQADYLRQAISCFQEALKYRTPQAAPLAAAATQSYLGMAYRHLAKWEDQDQNWGRAADCFKVALVYQNPDSALLDYIQTLVYYGWLYGDQNQREKQCAAWREAEKYYRQMGHLEMADRLARALAGLC